MRAMTSSLIADRNENEPAALHAFDFAFHDAEFWWIDEVIRGVDRK